MLVPVVGLLLIPVVAERGTREEDQAEARGEADDLQNPTTD